MDFEEQCDGCAHKHDCSRIYEKMGKSKGPNVAIQVTLAFVLPVIVLVAAYLFFDSLIESLIKNEKISTIAALIPAAFCLAVYIWFLGLTGIRKKRNQIN